MFSNSAAWQVAPEANPLEVKPAPYRSPLETEIVIKNKAVAINPVDWAIQKMGSKFFPWIVYPTILGQDVAGEVVEVGSGVTRLKIGDRVVGCANGVTAKDPYQRGFQNYVVLQSSKTAGIPNSLRYENVAVLPLGLITAARGLFMKDQLALQLPSLSPNPTGKAVLIWGGGTSVGSNAIQLAVAARYEVITTASSKNFDYVKKLGASQAFDYNSPTGIDDIVMAFH
jgi:NADPH:quinone reductase-like Zn-dependent oxidoreductase